MKEYCSDHKKALITYSFNDKKEIQYVNRRCPFRIEIEDVNAGDWDQFDLDGRSLVFKTFDFNGNFFDFDVLPGVSAYGVRMKGRRAEALMCDGRIELWRGGTTSGFTFIETGIASARLGETPDEPIQQKCPNRFNGTALKIIHKGQVIYTDNGPRPVRYNIECNGDCKEEDLKIDDGAYPGYWCFTKDEQQRLQRLEKRIRNTMSN